MAQAIASGEISAPTSALEIQVTQGDQELVRARITPLPVLQFDGLPPGKLQLKLQFEGQPEVVREVEAAAMSEQQTGEVILLRGG